MRAYGILAFLFLLVVLSVPASGQFSVTLPLKVHNGTVLVEATVAGKAGWFLLDTGASTTVIQESLCKKDCSDYHRGSYHPQGIMLNASYDSATTVLEFAGRKMKGEFILMPRVYDDGDVHASGLIGEDVLRMFSSFTVNFRGSTLTLVW
jgi:hypothetical protein